MKNIFKICILTCLLASCGDKNEVSIDEVIENGDLSEIRAKRSKIVEEQTSISEKLKQLDIAIAKLDSVKKVPLVTTIIAKDTLFNHFLELQGSVKTKKNIVLYPEYAGTLTRIYVKEGQRVSRGQVLAKIDDGGLSQQVAQMEVQSALAKTTFERQEKLWNQKIGSEIQFLQAKANFEAQENAVKQMKSQLGKTTINAPFSGIVDDIIAEQGTVVAPGQTSIIRIINLDDMYINIEVPENYINQVSAGRKAQVHFPILNETIDTEIRQAGNYINPNNRSFTVEVAIPNKSGKIKPNLTAKVRINDYTSNNAILIPQSIISENSDGEQYVYVTSATNNQNIAVASQKIVQTGKTQGDLIEITKGIKSGDPVIREGARSVKNGQEVEILKN